jgi:hypothetical protein
MNGRWRGGRVTVVELAAAQSGWRAGLHQIAREVSELTDPLLTLFFDKQRLRRELEEARDREQSRDRMPLENPLEAQSRERRIEDDWPGDHWPLDSLPSGNNEPRDDLSPKAELPPQLDGWDNEGVRNPWEDEWPSR